MDSMREDDPTLPIDFDQTDQFPQFLDYSSQFNQPDNTLLDDTLANNTEKIVEKKKRRSYSTNDQYLEKPSNQITMREQDNVISGLKKENFGLKMRIYYMEERLADTYDSDIEDALKKNIGLKVTIEELKQELTSKSILLSKASHAMEQLSNNEQKIAEEEVHKLKEELGEAKNKMTLIDKELSDKKSENERLEKLLAVSEENHQSLSIQKQKDEETFKTMIEELEFTVQEKQNRIETLQKDLKNVAGSANEYTEANTELQEKLETEKCVREDEIRVLKSQLIEKSNLYETLKDNFAIADKSVKTLRSNLHEKEIEHQRSITKLKDQIKQLGDTIQSKNIQIQEKDMQLSKTKKDMLQSTTQRIQFELDSLRSKDSQIVELNLSLKQQEYDLEKLKALVEEKDKDIVFYSSSKLKMEEELKKCKDVMKEQMQQLRKDASRQDKMQQRKIIELTDLYHGLQLRLRQHLTHNEKYFQHLMSVLHDKDLLIKNLVTLGLHSGNLHKETDLDNIIKNLEITIKQEDEDYQKFTSHSLNTIQTKSVELAELQQTLHTKENLLQQNTAENNVLKEQIKILQHSEKKDKTLLKELMISIEKSSAREQALQEQFCKDTSVLNTALTQLKGHVLLNQQEVKNIQSYFLNLCKNSENPCVKSEKFQENADKSFSAIESFLKELSTLKDNTINAVNLNNKQLISSLKDNEKNVQDLRKALHTSQNEKKQELVELNQQLLSAEYEIKNVNAALSKLKQSHQPLDNSYLNTIEEKDKSIEILLMSNKDKDESISDLMSKLQQEAVKKHFDQSTEPIKDLTQQNSLFSGNDENEHRNTLCGQEKSLEYLNEKLCSSVCTQVAVEDGEDELIEKLKDFFQVVDQEKKKYVNLVQKLQNNKDTESRLKLLEQELLEVAQMRKDLQQILCHMLQRNTLATKENVGSLLQQESVMLTEKLEEMTCHAKKLQHCLDEREKENMLLVEELKRCEEEAKQMNSELQAIKVDYEQLAQEISLVNDQSHQLKERNERLLDEKEKLNTDLLECYKQIESMKTQLKIQSASKVEHSENKKQVSLLNRKLILMEDAYENLKKKFDPIQKENEELKPKLSQAEKDLVKLNKTLERIMEEMNKRDAAKIPEQPLSDGTDEKKTLEKDVKELCKINSRLRSKVKDLSKALQDIKSEKDAEVKKLYCEVQKAKQAFQDLERGIHKCRTCALGVDVICTQNNSAINNQQGKSENIFNEEIEKDGCLYENDNKWSLNRKSLEKEENLILLNEVKEELMEKTKQNTELENQLITTKQELKQTKLNLKNLVQEIYMTSSQIILLSNELAKDNNKNGSVLTERDAGKENGNYKELKSQLEEKLRELRVTYISVVREDSSSYKRQIGLLSPKPNHQLDEQLESFSPIHTSSQQNIALSSDAFTQTLPDSTSAAVQNNNDSLITMHIQEMRELRQHLEEAVKNNNALRRQLEERLAQVELDVTQLNDPQIRLTLIRDNDAMRCKLTEKDESLKHMKLKINDLMTQQESDRETIGELREQVHQLNELSANLKLEMEVYDRLVKQLGIDYQKVTPKEVNSDESDRSILDKNLFMSLLDEIRHLRHQLKQSIDVNRALQQKLEQEVGRPISLSPVSKSPVEFSTNTNFTFFDGTSIDESMGLDEQATNKWTSCENNSEEYFEKVKCGQQMYIQLCEYNSLKQLVMESIRLLSTTQKKLTAYHKNKDSLSIGTLIKDLNQVRKNFKELTTLLDAFVAEEDKFQKCQQKNMELKNEVERLKKLLGSREKYIKSTLTMIEEHNWKSDNIEELLKKHLMKTKDTLKTTKGNLQMKGSRSQSRNNTSSSLDATQISADEL